MPEMTNLFALFVISIALVNVTPVLGASDIQAVCDQTPDLTVFGQFLRNNPDVYNDYAKRVDTTFYIPTNKAMSDHFAKTGQVLRRATDLLPRALNQVQNNTFGGAYGKRAATTRFVRFTEDTTSSPTGMHNVIVKVNSGPGSQPTNATLFAGAGDTANIVIPDLPCTQGVVQGVNSVFTLPLAPTTTLTNTNRTLFLASANAAGLGSVYDAALQVTIFAPIDSAFTGQSTLSAAGVRGHVVGGTAFYTPLLVDGAVLPTTQGGNLYVRVVNDEDFYINCVHIVQTDAISYNGVIHAVESILTPLYAPPTCSGLPSSTNSVANTNSNGGSNLNATANSNTTSNSNGVVQYTGLGSANKAVNMMAIFGTVLAAVGIVF